MSEQLDLGALRNLADVSAKMGYKVRLTPAELSALLAAAGEREELRAEVEAEIERNDKLEARVKYYEGAMCFSPPRMWVLPGDVKASAIEPERVVDMMKDRAALQAEVERLRAALGDAAKSLRTISTQAGRGLDDMVNVRGYANSRAGVAEAALAPAASETP